MKQALDAARRWINPAQIGTFMKVASMACEREIINFVRAAVLPCNHVDVMQDFAVPLMKPAVLAALPRPLPDESPGSSIHR